MHCDYQEILPRQLVVVSEMVHTLRRLKVHLKLAADIEQICLQSLKSADGTSAHRSQQSHHIAQLCEEVHMRFLRKTIQSKNYL